VWIRGGVSIWMHGRARVDARASAVVNLSFVVRLVASPQASHGRGRLHSPRNGQPTLGVIFFPVKM